MLIEGSDGWALRSGGAEEASVHSLANVLAVHAESTLLLVMRHS